MKYDSKYSKIYNLKNAGEKYDKVISNKFESTIFDMEKRILKKIFMRLETKNKKYMDFATGTGRIIEFISKTFIFKKYLGIDLSKNMIGEARKKIKNKKVKFKELDILSRDADEIRKQDVITCFRLILNLEDKNREKILKKLNSLLTKNGYLIINNHMNRYSVLGIIAWSLHNLFGVPMKGRSKSKKTIINTLSKKQIKKLLKQSGFYLIKTYSFCILPGNKNIILLPKKILIELEMFLSKIPIINLFGKDQIYVCKKLHYI